MSIANLFIFIAKQTSIVRMPCKLLILVPALECGVAFSLGLPDGWGHLWTDSCLQNKSPPSPTCADPVSVNVEVT